MRSRTVLLLAAAWLVVAGGSTVARGQEAQWKAFTDSGWRLARKGDPAAGDHLAKALTHAQGFPPGDARRALTQSYQAFVAGKAGKAADADRHAREALAALDALPADSADPYAGRGLNALASLYQARKDYSRADQLYRRALAAEEKARGANGVGVALVLGNRAGLLEEQGRYEEAEPLREREVQILDTPTAPGRADLAAAAHLAAGRMYRQWGRDAKAEPHLARAVELKWKSGNRNDPAAIPYLIELGRLYLALKQPAKANLPLRHVLEQREKSAGKTPQEQVELADALHDMGCLHLLAGRPTSAEPLLVQALRIREKAFPAGDLRTAVTLHALATLHVSRKRSQQAEGELQRAYQIKQKVLGADHAGTAAALEDLGLLSARTNDLESAAGYFRKALAARERSAGPRHPSVAGTLHHLANAYRDLRQYADAEPLYRRAVAIKEKEYGPDNPELASVLDSYAAMLLKAGRAADAAAAAKRANALRAKTGG
ncbi:MAG TPA: tetratricopeptide repeat protein [Fimbriiglobus sp.]|nr:tetratricopeptide repeat protein [Fimbriiglobus sp.]